MAPLTTRPTTRVDVEAKLFKSFLLLLSLQNSDPDCEILVQSFPTLVMLGNWLGSWSSGGDNKKFYTEQNSYRDAVTTTNFFQPRFFQPTIFIDKCERFSTIFDDFSHQEDDSIGLLTGRNAIVKLIFSVNARICVWALTIVKLVVPVNACWVSCVTVTTLDQAKVAVPVSFWKRWTRNASQLNDEDYEYGGVHVSIIGVWSTDYLTSVRCPKN